MCDTLRSPQMQLRTSAAVKSEKLSRPLEVSVMVGPSREWFSEIFCVSQLTTKPTHARASHPPAPRALHQLQFIETKRLLKMCDNIRHGTAVEALWQTLFLWARDLRGVSGFAGAGQAEPGSRLDQSMCAARRENMDLCSFAPDVFRLSRAFY